MTEKTARPKDAKLSREERLAQNLRANLRRRKQATRKIAEDSTTPKN